MLKQIPLLLLCMLASLSCSKEQNRPQSSPAEGIQRKSAPQAIPPFDESESFTFLLKQTSFGPRNPNSVGHKACLDFLASELRSLTPDVELQPFTAQGYSEVLPLTNVFARFNPGAAARVLLLAHWDSRPRAEHDENPARRNEPILGANDGASGVAVLLELARMLHAQPPAIGVDILLVDGEDYGKEGNTDLYLLGTRQFARTKPNGYLPRFGILLDMVGDAQLEIPREQNSMQYAPDIVDLVWNTARELGVHQFIDEKGEQITDDHLPLNEVGIRTIDIIDFNYPDASHRYWHTHEDTPEHCSAQSLGAVGTVLAAVVYGQTP